VTRGEWLFIVLASAYGFLCFGLGIYQGKRVADHWYSTRCVHRIIGYDVNNTPPLLVPIGSCMAAAASDEQAGKVHLIWVQCKDIPK
jgi:hypothetical protein